MTTIERRAVAPRGVRQPPPSPTPPSPTPPGLNPPGPNRPSPRPSALTAGLALGAVVALGAAAWFGVGWGKALFVDRPQAQARDAALVDAQQAAVNIASSDTNDLDGTFATMRSSVTGDELAAEIDSVREQLARQAGSGVKLTAKVQDAALTELDRGAGTATALVVLDQHYADATTYRDTRITQKLSLVNVDGTWKAAAVAPLGTATLLGEGELVDAAAPGGAPAEPAPEGGTR